MARRLDSTRSGGSAACCLIWLPAGYDAPADLLEGLRRRGVGVREAHDAPSVMAGLSRGGGRRIKVVVVVEPDVLRDADDLVAAVRAYHPKVAVWRFSRGARPPLDKWSGGEAAGGNGRTTVRGVAEAEPPSVGEAAVAEGAAAIDDPPASRDSGTKGGESEGEHEPLLTDEELAMLLGGDEEDDRPGEQARRR